MGILPYQVLKLVKWSMGASLKTPGPTTWLLICIVLPLPAHLVGFPSGKNWGIFPVVAWPKKPQEMPKADPESHLGLVCSGCFSKCWQQNPFICWEKSTWSPIKQQTRDPGNWSAPNSAPCKPRLFLCSQNCCCSRRVGEEVKQHPKFPY